MSALDELLSNEHARWSGETLRHPCGSRSSTLRVREAIAELASLRQERDMWKSQAELGYAAIDEYEAEIGDPPEGSHPDEQKPRAETWHRERQNWIAQTAAMSATIAQQQKRIEAGERVVEEFEKVEHSIVCEAGQYGVVEPCTCDLAPLAKAIEAFRKFRIEGPTTERKSP